MKLIFNASVTQSPHAARFFLHLIENPQESLLQTSGQMMILSSRMIFSSKYLSEQQLTDHQ